MTIPRARPLDAIAAAVPDVDVVLAPDEAWADVLRGAVEAPERVTTPEAAIGAPEIDPIDRLKQLADAVEAPLSTVDRLHRMRLRSWRLSGDPSLGTGTGPAAAVAEAVQSMAGPEAALAEAEPLGESVAVIAPGLFDALQRRVVPEDATTVDVVENGPRRGATVEVGQTRWAVVEATVEDLRERGAGTVVADPAGPYWGLVRAALAASGADVERAVPGRAAIIELLELAAGAAPARVRDARTVLAALGLDAPEEPDGCPLASLDDERASWVRAIAEGGRRFSTVAAVLDQFEERGGPPQPALRRAVDRLGLGDAPPTTGVVADVAWLVREGPLGAVGSGALLDAGSTTVVDREGTYLLGPGTGWLRPRPVGLGAVWTDRERHRLAQVFAPGPDVNLRIAEGDLGEAGLGALLGGVETRTLGDRQSPEGGFQFAPEGRPRTGHDRFTQSTLNRLLTSPRDALFDDLLSAPETAAQRRGTAVHEYAELALAAPAAIEALGPEALVEDIVESVAELAPPWRRPVLVSRVRAAIAVVEAYLEGVEPFAEGLPGYAAPSWLTNELAERAGVTVASPVTEQYFRDDELGVSGVVDLIRSDTHLVDFKTGSPPPAGSLVARARGEGARRDVQLPLYLAALRRGRSDRPLRMTFVYCYGASTTALRGRPWLDALERSVPYRPAPVTAVTAESIERLATTVPPDHPRRRVIEAVGAARIATAVEDTAPGDEAALRARLTPLIEATDLDAEVAGAGGRSVVVGLTDRRAWTLYRDDLDAFEGELDRWRQRRRRYDRTGYPLGDPSEDRLAFPDLHVDLSPLVAGGDPP